jgi:hypothetical protein
VDVPPFNARSPGVLVGGATSAPATAPGAVCRNRIEYSTEKGRLFEFESELEANLAYIPMAGRLKLDQCGIKLSLAEWQRLSEYRRQELLRTPCDGEGAIANYRQLLCSLVKQCTGAEPPTIPVAPHPPWTDRDVPEQLARAVTAIGIAVPSPARWRMLTALERFALLKLSREGRDHRNLEPALREFGLL